MRAPVLALVLALLSGRSLGAIPMQAEPRYEPATVIDVMGTVEEVRDVTDPALIAGIHVTLHTDNESLHVYLSPSDFMHEFGFAIAKGDRVQVVGSKVKYGLAVLLLAREVRRYEATLYLRDKKGRPFWKDGGASK